MTALEIISKLDINRISHFKEQYSQITIYFKNCDNYLLIDFCESQNSLQVYFKNAYFVQNSVNRIMLAEAFKKVKETVGQRDEDFFN